MSRTNPVALPRRGQDFIVRSTGDERLMAKADPATYLNRADLTRRMQEALGADTSDSAGWQGQPWVTPVLGSGPLGLPSEFIRICDLLPQAVVASLREHRVLKANLGLGAAPERWLSAFTKTMVDQRAGDERAQHLAQVQSDADEPTEESVSRRINASASSLILVAAQLTRTFHRISLDTCRPVSRWGSERGLMSSEHDRFVDLVDEYVDVLIEACREAQRALAKRAGDEPELRATLASIARLVQAVQSDLADDAKVTLVHLEQVTEAAWYLLVDSIVGSAYPGWTNLLLRLVLSDDSNVGTGRVRPRWHKLQDLAQSIRDIVEPVSRDSWTRSNSTPDHRENSTFYDAVARTLWAQSDARRRYLAASGEKHDPLFEPPRPVAYVSSFDYELEMALWRTAPEFGRDSFSVVVPVYAVQDGVADIGDFVWLEGEISAPSELPVTTGERNPADFDTMRKVESWRLLHRQSKDAPDHPIVVRIVGCPLLGLPVPDAIYQDTVRYSGAFGSDLNKAKLGATTGFVHSVTVDEYLALRQTERDWMWSIDEQDEPHHNRGLPADYFRSGASAPQRYWMVMGVPFRDPAVRLRLMAVLAREGSTAGVGPKGFTPPDEPQATATARAEAQVPVADVSTGRDPRGPIWPRPSTLHSHTERSLDPGRTQTNNEDEDVITSESRRFGVAINTRVDDEETMLLNSLGLAVVQGRCETFTDVLAQHARWLRVRAGQVERERELHA